MDEKKRDWDFECRFYIKRNYIGSVYHSDKQEVIRSLKKDIVNIENQLNMGKTDTMAEILFAGVEIIKKEIEEGNRGKLPKRGTSEYARWRIAKERVRVLRKRAMYNDFDLLLDENGVEWMQDFGEDIDADTDDYLRKYSFTNPSQKQSARDRDWLCGFFSNGDEIKTSEVREAAERDDLIDSSDQAWGRLAKTATRSGYTGNCSKGYWKKPAK